MTSLAFAVIEGIARIAHQLGRWFIQRLTRTTSARLAGYMEGKIAEFHTRHERARTARRGAWLLNRIARWTAALEWLEANAVGLRMRAVRAYCRGADTVLASIPLRAVGERIGK